MVYEDQILNPFLNEGEEEESVENIDGDLPEEGEDDEEGEEVPEI